MDDLEGMFFASDGIWPLCTTAQGDGVPCPDATRQCEGCVPPRAAVYDALLPDPFAPGAPLPVSGA